MIQIIPYQSDHQLDIDEMMLEINAEFSLQPPPLNYQPKPPSEYWLAFYSAELAGTVALNYESDFAVLKRMFVKAAYRGKQKGIAATLLRTAVLACKEKSIKTIYLGTIDVFKAAQAFYEKNGFKRIDPQQLPKNFPHNPIDVIFYKLNLNENYFRD